MSNPSAQNARDLLDRAESTSRRAAGFSFAWLCYVALCAGGAIAAIGLAYANVTDASPAPAWIAGGLWVGIGVVFTSVASVSSPPSRRGFSARWAVFIALWAVAWAAVAFLNTSFTLVHGIAAASAFMVLAIVGPLWEIVAVKK